MRKRGGKPGDRRADVVWRTQCTAARVSPRSLSQRAGRDTTIWAIGFSASSNAARTFSTMASRRRQIPALCSRLPVHNRIRHHNRHPGHGIRQGRDAGRAGDLGAAAAELFE